MKIKESKIQCAYFSWVDYMSNHYKELKCGFHTPNGERRDARTGAILKRMGVKPGVPDIIYICPRNGYTGLAIELKSANGRLSKAQKEWAERFRNENWLYQVCYSTDEAIETTCKYLELDLQ